MSHMSEIDVAGYFSSASTLPDYERVLLRSMKDFAGGGCCNPILAHQPFFRRRIDQCHVDFVSVLPAEILKRSVSYKRIHQFQLAGGNQVLYIFYRTGQEFGRSLPRVCLFLANGMFRQVDGASVDCLNIPLAKDR